jgi:hypothetical protein
MKTREKVQWFFAGIGAYAVYEALLEWVAK